MKDFPFTEPPSLLHANSNSISEEHKLDSEIPFTTPTGVLSSAFSSPPKNIQAVLSLHKALTQHLSDLGYNTPKEGTTTDHPPHIQPSQNASTLPIINKAVTTFPNNDKTLPLFRFYNDGSKQIKNVGKRKYYKCNEKDCPAKYTITHADISDSPSRAHTHIFSPDPHNHPPPTNPSINPKVKESSISHMRVGASPANVHKQLVHKAPLPLSSADVPTLAAMRQWKHRDAYKDSESSVYFFFYIFYPFFANASSQMMS